MAGWVFASLVLSASNAHATYSVAAVDRATQEVGGAGASCVGSLDVAVIYGAAPGLGVVHAQASLNVAGRNRAVELLEDGQPPAEIIAAITAPAFDVQAGQRQYGVVDLAGRVDAFTGNQTGDWAGHRTGEVQSFVASVQGNILTGPEVVDQAYNGFIASGCDLAERLMLAMEAGRVGGIGDARCTDDGLPADSAFIRVDGPSGGPPRLDISVTNTPTDPVALLRAAFDDWRQDNPCPAAPVDAGTPPPDAALTTDAGLDAGPRGQDALPNRDATAAGDAGAAADDAGPISDAGLLDGGTVPGSDAASSVDAASTSDSETYPISGACRCADLEARGLGKTLTAALPLWLIFRRWRWSRPSRPRPSG